MRASGNRRHWISLIDDDCDHDHDRDDCDLCDLCDERDQNDNDTTTMDAASAADAVAVGHRADRVRLQGSAHFRSFAGDRARPGRWRGRRWPGRQQDFRRLSGLPGVRAGVLDPCGGPDLRR